MHQVVNSVIVLIVTVIAMMMIFKHEDLVIDLNNTNKGKLYKAGQLIFIGDGYRCITMMMRNAKDYKPIQQKFKPQLTMKSKSK